jgi:pimeloyl-ACP methyl ester carboxylesterase
MLTVITQDRTDIAYWQSGEGPPLLLIHGATADHTTTWRLVLPELELMRSQRNAWEIRLRNVPTLPRELSTLQHYTFRPERFKALQLPVTLLVGEDSPPREFQNAEGVAGALPNAQIVLLPGKQHAAMYTAPDLFVREVIQILVRSF